ncbi:hydrogenase expression protein HypA [Photobacterium japonica]|uniref:hydrogenase expression protein HypA n=1 Tax=Photobacterium japonica TaxID=2910235 RepID=UPI003D129398
MRRYLGKCFWAACSLLLAACGGGTDTPTPVAGTPTPVSNTFTVSVDLPASMTLAQRQPTLFPTAYADAVQDLTEQNFAAVWLDDTGKVFESIDITRWVSQGDGRYELDAGTQYRINAVLLMNPAGVPVFTLGEALPEGLYMIPLATERLAITLESSLAYYAFTQRVVQDGGWGVFSEIFNDAPQGKVLFALQDINSMATDISDTLFPKISVQGLTLKELMTLSIVQSMTTGRVERFFTEQAAAIADIQAILGDGYWQVGSFTNNSGSGILVDSTQYDGTETTVNEFRWEKSGNADISLNDFFTYFSESTAFGTEDITHQVLTSNGWKGLFSYLRVVFATQTTALLTDAALSIDDKAGITLDANVYSLNGKKMHDFLSSKNNHYVTRYIQPDATFSEGASGFYFTWRPEGETYLLCDTSNDQDTCRVFPIQMPDAGYTTLDEVITPLANIGPNITDVNGFQLSDNIVVELIDDNFFTLRYWNNIAGDEWAVQEVGAWAPTTVAGQSVIRFDVPDIMKQLASNYRFNSTNLFLIADRGFVNIGEVLLKNTEYHYSGFDNDAKAQIISAASRDNLPPFDNCDFGNTAQATAGLFLNAVTECGGDERFTGARLDTLIGHSLVQISEDGEISAHILRDDNTWEMYRHTDLKAGSRQWALTEEGYLALFPDANDSTTVNRWALTHYEYTLRLLAIKQFSQTDNGATIDNVMTREYAPDSLAACSTLDSGWDQATTTPVTTRTLEDYQTQITQCKTVWFDRNPVLTETLLIGNTGDNSDDKALQFASDSSRFLTLSDDFSGEYFLGQYVDSDGCGFNIDIRWKIDDDGTLYYEALDGSMNERIALTDTDGLKLAIKAFNHQTRWQDDETRTFAATDGELWSDIVTLIPASDVPDVTPIEPPPPTPPADDETPTDGETPTEGDTPGESENTEEPAGPPTGTILNDGQQCAYLEETPAP